MELGRVLTANFRIGGRGSHQVWKHRKETDGGAINEMMVHMIDLAIWYFGPVKEAKVVDSHLMMPERVIGGETVTVDAEDYVLALFEMESGVRVTIQADLVTPSFNQFVE